jgi:hypothetical protein
MCVGAPRSLGIPKERDHAFRNFLTDCGALLYGKKHLCLWNHSAPQGATILVIAA